MDTRTGEVMPYAEMEYRMAHGVEPRHFKEVPYQRVRPKTGRNESCPCGSGKKFKKCCLNNPASKEEQC
jgi:uncharacterized protein YecA (UPF0149 family)